MSLNSITFIFLFLPIFLLIYYWLGAKGKLIALLIGSFIFYSWGSPRNMLVMLLLIAFNYASGLEIRNLRESGSRFALPALFTAVFGNAAILALFKYTTLEMPLGISFYVFSAISYLADIWLHGEEPERNPFYLALYISFFPKVLSGPIVQYRDMRESLHRVTVRKKDITSGINLFLIGMFKKILLADSLGRAFNAVQDLSSPSVMSHWLGMIYYSLQLYFDFSGYSDMAIGLARMLGFHFDKNFNYPYLSKSIPEFWRRWHISLGAWFRDYVYIPLGGNRCSVPRHIFNLMVVWLLTGVWHGSALNFVVWGLYHGCFVLLDRFVIRHRFDGLPDQVRIAITDLIAFFGWVFFFNPDLSSAISYFGKMFGAGSLAFWNSGTTFVFLQNLILLIVAILTCGPLVRRLHSAITFRLRPRGALYVSLACYAIGFAFCVASLLSSTYTTFLYAQF